jgi:hypothetical protein
MKGLVFAQNLPKRITPLSLFTPTSYIDMADFYEEKPR